MYKIFAQIGDWLLKNSVQKVLTGAGLSVVTYLGIILAVREAFEYLINSAQTAGADALALLGIYGIDFVLSGFVSVAVFLLTLNEGKLFIRKGAK